MVGRAGPMDAHALAFLPFALWTGQGSGLTEGPPWHVGCCLLTSDVRKERRERRGCVCLSLYWAATAPTERLFMAICSTQSGIIISVTAPCNCTWIHAYIARFARLLNTAEKYSHSHMAGVPAHPHWALCSS
ncbi:hypothetical protein V8E53_011567 [Lactarius tabidus]